MGLIARRVNGWLHRWILPPGQLIAQIPEERLTMAVCSRDNLGRRIYQYRTHEPELTRALAQHVRFRPGDVVLDGGANLGWYSLMIARWRADTGRVLAFEPDPINFALLEGNLRRNGIRSVTPLQCAAGAESAVLKLHRCSRRDANCGGHTLLPPERPGGAAIDVRVVTLDAACAEQKCDQAPVRLLKLDIEGWELPALRGAAGVLRRCEWALVEHNVESVRRAGGDPADLVRIMVDAGFVPLDPYDSNLPQLLIDRLPDDTEQHNVLWHRRAGA